MEVGRSCSRADFLNSGASDVVGLQPLAKQIVHDEGCIPITYGDPRSGKDTPRGFSHL